MCTHQPQCPTADRPDREAARVVAAHPEQGWSRLCNGVIVFDDHGQLLPDGRAVPPVGPAPLPTYRPASLSGRPTRPAHRPPGRRLPVAA